MALEGDIPQFYNSKRLLTPLVKHLEAGGITLQYLIQKLKEELEAQETKFFQHEGKVITKRDVVAWAIRQKARQDAHKLRGDYPAEQLDLEGSVTLLAPTPVKKPKKSGI